MDAGGDNNVGVKVTGFENWIRILALPSIDVTSFFLA